MKWSIFGLFGLLMLGGVFGIFVNSGDVRWLSLVCAAALVIADRLGWYA